MHDCIRLELDIRPEKEATVPRFQAQRTHRPPRSMREADQWRHIRYRGEHALRCPLPLFLRLRSRAVKPDISSREPVAESYSERDGGNALTIPSSSLCCMK